MKKLSHLARIQYAYQEEMKGLGDAILCARTFASSEPVAILLGDTILHAQGPVSPLQSMVNLHNQTNGSVIALRKVPLHMVSQYGVVSGKPISKRITRIEGLIENPPGASPQPVGGIRTLHRDTRSFRKTGHHSAWGRR